MFQSAALEAWMLKVVGSMPCRGGGGWNALEALFWVPAMVGIFLNVQLYFHFRFKDQRRGR